MRPTIWQHQLRTEDLHHPVLALLAPVEIALEALVLALRAHHPRLAHHPPPGEPWDLELRRAQSLAALARALQATLVDYHGDQLERTRGRAHDGGQIPY